MTPFINLKEKLSNMRYLFCFIIITSSLIAQPGYQGKKLALGYSSSLGLSFLGNSYSQAETVASLLIKHTGSLEYTVGRFTSLGLAVGFQRLGSDNLTQLEPVFERPVYAKIRNIQPSLYVKFFSKKHGNLSPFGLYYKLMLSQNFYKAVDNINNKPLAQNYNNYGFTLGIGKTRIFMNSIIFDYSVDLGLNLSLNNDNKTADAENINDEIEDAIFTSNVILIKLGIGWLPPIR